LTNQDLPSWPPLRREQSYQIFDRSAGTLDKPLIQSARWHGIERGKGITYGRPDAWGHSDGGNPLATATAYAGTKYLIENDILAHVKWIERHLFAHLRALKGRFSFIVEVRGKGLLAALEFDSDIAGKLLTYANEAGVLVNGVKPNALRLMPSLTITAEEIDEGIGRLEQALRKV
jgi:acetylornithine/succinyldiaminopimelate/putrescine aminotransferase